MKDCHLAQMYSHLVLKYHDVNQNNMPEGFNDFYILYSMIDRYVTRNWRLSLSTIAPLHSFLPFCLLLPLSVTILFPVVSIPDFSV